MARAQRIRHGAVRVALAIAAVVATLAAAEFALRVWSDPQPQRGLRALHELRPDRPWIYGLRPGAETTFAAGEGEPEILYRINEDGFRDRSFPSTRRADTLRIVVLGDSVALGYGVERDDAFPKQLEQMLERPVEVLNLAVTGYNPYTEAALFSDVGVKYRPDLVLVQFCSNDLNDPTLHFDAQTRLHFAAIPDEAIPDLSARERFPAAPVSVFAGCRGLRLCDLLDDAMLALRPEADSNTQLRALVSHDSLSPRVGAWLGDRYAEIAREAKAIDARFAVLAFPDQKQIEPGGTGELQRQLVAIGERRGWQTIDLWPVFSEAAASDPEPLFLDLWHPSVRGHRLAARAIAEQLPAVGLVPSR